MLRGPPTPQRYREYSRMIIKYRKRDMEPLFFEGAEIKVEKEDYKNLKGINTLLMIKEKSNEDYNFGQFVSQTNEELSIFDRKKGLHKDVLKTISKDNIENVYKVVYINLDFEKYQNYLDKNGGDLSKIASPLFATE